MRNISKTTWQKARVSNFLLEACVETFEESLFAYQQDASQLELCSRLDLDGLTPSLALTKKILEEIKIPTKVMIRNRSGDFVYSKEDLQAMHLQIESFKVLNIQGFVLGALTNENQLDFEALTSLCQTALPFPITIHKCVDRLSDISQLSNLKKISNVKFVLTSGGEITASKGISRLQEMKSILSPEIQIIPAGKITSKNVQEIHAQLHAPIYHGRKIVS